MPENSWPTGTRDTTEFPEIPSVELRGHLKGFLALNGVNTQDYDLQRTKSGLAGEDQRLRSYRKMYERLGLLYVQSDKIILTDLAKAISNLVTATEKNRTDLESEVRSRAIDILSRYQLLNPVDKEHHVPSSCDVLPYVCIWKAMLELDNKLHHEELNRVIMRVMRMADLDAAMAKIRAARQNLGDYDGQSPSAMHTSLGERVIDDQPQARMAPWFSLAGWGGLIIAREQEGDGFRHLIEVAIEPLRQVVHNPSSFYSTESTEDWTRHFLWGAGDRDPMTSMLDHFRQDLQTVGLQYSEDLTRRFIASSLSKSIVILTGLTGSGKTKLAQIFAKWIAPSQEHYMLIPVGADWIGRENLLGYPDALDSTKYVRTPLLDLLLHAVGHQDQPHFAILDEMNLSHVERYFADFLSAIESGEAIHLYSSKTPADNSTWREGIPPTIGRYPHNLVIIGTVNVDETTYMFSPKVLDRAHAIEFRMEKGEVASFLASHKTADINIVNARGAVYASQFMRWRNEPSTLSQEDMDALSSELMLFFDVLSTFDAEFGFRVMDDMFRFLHYYKVLSRRWDITSAIDVLIYQKILPKLNGSQRKLQPVLLSLAILCYDKREPALAEKAKNAYSNLDLAEDILAEKLPLANAHYPSSYAKLRRMLKHLIENGFTSFAEA